MNAVRGPAGPRTGLAEAVVDLRAVRHNVVALRRQPATRTGLLAVVKADAFGHGAVEVARAAVEAGATWLGVARAAEARELRAAGLTVPILVWLYDATELPELTGVDLSISTVDELRQAATVPGLRQVHLKLDTGLHRGGSMPEHWVELTRAAAHYEALGAVAVRGIWSHLSHGDEPDAAHSREQLARLRVGVAQARGVGLSPSVVHLANSAGAVTLDAPDCNLIRAGAGLYGIDELGIGLRPAMTLVSRVAQVRRVRAGAGVSYHHDYVAPAGTTLALVPLGYADGIPRSTGGGSVWLHGVRMPIRGRIAMDQFVVDAGDVPVEAGEPVVVFGPGDHGEPTAGDWARWAGTIPHEIYCGLGPRVPRRYDHRSTAGPRAVSLLQEAVR